MAGLHTYQKGDVVFHTRRPEWGEGVIDQALPIKHDGQPAQRLVVKFVHRGRVVLNTALAPVALKGEDPNAAETAKIDRFLSTDPEDHGDALDRADRGMERALEQLTLLPAAMTDPFASLASRLTATLDSYRYAASPPQSRQPRDALRLIEWAIAQTQLRDPFSRFTRQQIEEAYERFAYDRDGHLLLLVRDAKKNDQSDQINAAAAKIRDPVSRAALEAVLKI